MKKFLAASLCMFVVAACAMGGQKKSAMSPAPPQAVDSSAGAAPSPAGASAKDQLDELYAKVEQERQEMQLPEPQLAGPQPATPMAEPQLTSQTDTTCKPAASETCQTSCKLSDSICDNSTKICKLAEELQSDEDAAAKCEKATKTCKTSHEKCCGCML